jgi:hypothetical protein
MRIAGVMLLAAVLAVAGPAAAGNKGNPGKGQGKGHSGGDAAEVLAGAVITAFEVAIINDYLHQHRANLPPVFAEAKPLPPGIAMKLARGGSMPPGIAKRYFPNNLLAQLPPRPGQEWLVVGTDILLISAATGIILDVLHDIL